MNNFINCLQEQVNNTSNKYVLISSNHSIEVNFQDYVDEKFYPFRGIVTIDRTNLVIDGMNTLLNIHLSNFKNNWAIFDIKSSSKNIEIKNWNIKLFIKNINNINDCYSILFNNSFGLKINNCKFEIVAEKEVNLFGIYNNGNNVNLENCADNLVISNSEIKVRLDSDMNNYQSKVYGIYNNLANSISVQNNFIYATINGESAAHTSIGIYTNGRFGRFIGNNIKANGSHPEGLKKEKPTTIAFENEGIFSIISNNNVVSEWSGMAIGIFNSADSVVITNNKVLATHTIFGVPIRNNGEKILMLGNIILSTSRNARLIEHNGSNSSISNNLMEVLLPKEECQSGCGIYASSDDIKSNIITGNIICNIRDVGLFVGMQIGHIENNQVISDKAIPICYSNNVKIKELLKEKNIKSIERSEINDFKT